MDGLFKKLQYKEFLKKLNDAEASIAKEQEEQLVHNKLALIHDNLANHNSKNEHNWMLGFMSVATVIVTIVQYYYYSLSFRLLILILLIGFFVIMRYRLITAIKYAQQQSARYKSGGGTISHRIDYLHAGLEVKRSRTIFARGIFIIFFPLLMISVAELLSGPFTETQFAVLMLLAYFVGGSFWFKFFDNDLLELEFISQHLEEIHEDIMV